MKKYLLASIAILFAAAFVWAEEATIQQPDIDIEADATVSWGIDLGSGDISEKTIKHGFKNTDSWTVKFPLIKKGDKVSAKSEAPVYGEVKLTDIELNIQSKHDENGGKFTPDGKVDGLKAKLVFYGAYLQVYNKPGFASNYANLWEPLKKSSDYDDKEDDVIYKFKPSFTGYGTKIGYANADLMDLDVGLKFGSNGNWNSGDPGKRPAETKFKYFNGRDGVGDDGIAYDIINHEVYLGKNVDIKTIPEVEPDVRTWAIAKDKEGKNITTPPEGTYLFAKRGDADGKDVHSKYGAGLDFALKPLGKMLGLALTVNSTFVQAKDYQRVGGDTDTNVNLSTGAEITSEPIDALKLKLGFDGGMMYGKKFAWDMLFNTEYKWVGGGLYVASDTTSYGAGKTDMAAYVKFETKAGAKEASNLVKGLDAGAYLGFYKLLTTKKAAELPMLLKGWVSYKAAINDSSWIKPFTTIWMETNRLYHNKPGVAYDVGVTYSPVEKVELTAKWMHGKVGNNHLWNLVSAPAVSDHNGRFTLALKVKY